MLRAEKKLFWALSPIPFESAGHGEIYHTCVEKAVRSLGWEYQNHFTFQPKASFLKRVQEFSSLFNQKAPLPRIFFVEACRTRDLIPLYWASKRLAPQDTLLFLLRYGPQNLPLKGRLHRLLLQKAKQWILLSDSERIAHNFRPLSLQIVPIPHIDFTPQTPEIRKPYTCWWPGQPRPAKGLEEICRLAQQSAPHFELYLSQATPLPEKRRLKVHRLPSELSREDYLAQLSEMQVVFLPYDPKIYGEGTSGLFVESVIAGKIPLVKRGSWLAYELKRFGLEELIVAWDSPNFFSHLENLLKNEKVLSRLSEMQKSYHAYHSIPSFAQALSNLNN